MKRFALAALIAVATLFSVFAGDSGSLFGSLSVGLKSGPMFYFGRGWNYRWYQPSC